VGNVTVGAQELYAIYRRDFSFNKLTGHKGGYGPIADFGLQVGGDANAKNTAFGPEKRLLIGGVYLDWAVPVGFLKTAFEACHEWNQNGIVGTAVEFDTTFCFESAWSFPIKVAGHTVKFNGFFNVVAPKGRDGFGAQTKTEVLTRPEVVLDISPIFHRTNFTAVSPLPPSFAPSMHDLAKRQSVLCVRHCRVRQSPAMWRSRQGLARQRSRRRRMGQRNRRPAADVWQDALSEPAYHRSRDVPGGPDGLVLSWRGHDAGCGGHARPYCVRSQR
jgi:hypothetical protein